ncbi:MAG: hypothetical protein JO359_05190, partial [Candidatus Eremiobacteraeota bacterium]|nr:hypothetical protein [Candidatus Eremiobacteraeota bacterium]
FSASGGNTVGFTVNGNVASVVVSIVFSPGAPSPSFVVGQTNAANVVVTAKDADGNVITGPGVYNQPITITNSDTTGAFTIQGSPTITGPGTQQVLLQYNGKAVSNVVIGATAGSGVTVTPAVIFGGSSTATPSPAPTSSATATATPSVTGAPIPGTNCSAPALGAGTYTSVFAQGNTSGGVFTANTAMTASSWVKLAYSGSATPTGAPTATPTSGPTSTPGGTQAVNVYFGSYNLMSGTQGCFLVYTTVDGSPISAIGSGFNGAAVGIPNVSAGSVTFVSSGTITAMSITLGSGGGSGTVSLSNGDSGTVTVGAPVTFNIPSSSVTPTPAAPGPIGLSPNPVNYASLGQHISVTVTQNGNTNAPNPFSFGPVACPGPGGVTINPSPTSVTIAGGNATAVYDTVVTAGPDANCHSTVTGAGGISATLTLNP